MLAVLGTELRAADGIGWLSRQSLWLVALILLFAYTLAVGIFTFLFRIGGEVRHKFNYESYLLHR